MRDIELQDGDVVIEGNDLAIITGSRATRQRIEQKFRLWRGEWFLNTAAGVPWLQQVLGQRPSQQVIFGIVRRVVADDPEVDEVLNIEVDYTGSERRLSISFRARLTDGSIINGEA